MFILIVKDIVMCACLCVRLGYGFLRGWEFDHLLSPEFSALTSFISDCCTEDCWSLVASPLLSQEWIREFADYRPKSTNQSHGKIHNFNSHSKYIPIPIPNYKIVSFDTIHLYFLFQIHIPIPIPNFKIVSLDTVHHCGHPKFSW